MHHKIDPSHLRLAIQSDCSASGKQWPVLFLYLIPEHIGMQVVFAVSSEDGAKCGT